MSTIIWLLLLLANALAALVTYRMCAPAKELDRCPLCGSLADEDDVKFVCPECGQEWEG